MKLIISLIIALASLSAQAQTVTLNADAACPNRVCSDVSNDAAAAITIAASTYYATLTVIVDGKVYAGNRTTTVVSDTSASGVCTAQDGSYITVASAWAHTVRHINSGRAHYTITTWALMGGTIN